MQKSDIVLITFPFTDLSGSKFRPAVVLVSTSTDITVSFITTQISWQEPTDVLLQPNTTNGLRKTSLAAALAKGVGPGHVYRVEPTGEYENDPNLTDKKFPGNLTRSYRTSAPLKIVGELSGWEGFTPTELGKWREKLNNSKGEIIN